AAREIGGALAVQLGHVVWPFGLLPRYFREAGEPSVVLIAIALLVVLALGVVVANAPAQSPLRTGLLFAGIAYLPVCGVVGINRWFADSYMYLPLVGLAYAAVGAASARWPERPDHARTALRAAGLALAALAPIASGRRRR